MEENLDCMLEKLNLILELVQDCNSRLKKIKSRGESRYINSVPSVMLETRGLLRIFTFPPLLLVSSRIH